MKRLILVPFTACLLLCAVLSPVQAQPPTPAQGWQATLLIEVGPDADPALAALMTEQLRSILEPLAPTPGKDQPPTIIHFRFNLARTAVLIEARWQRELVEEDIEARIADALAIEADSIAEHVAVSFFITRDELRAWWLLHQPEWIQQR